MKNKLTPTKLMALIIFIITCFSAVKGDVLCEHTEIIDKERERVIPLSLYQSRNNLQPHLAPVIINHGYGAKNIEYSFIANDLAAQGFFVISIQHDLDTDAPLPRTGNLFERRKPIWEQGVRNILCTISELKKTQSFLNFNKIILIGHSNGGDISMMFTEKYCDLVEKVISLDSLRYPFPINTLVPILSLRANDTQADEGVLPKSGAVIVDMDNVKHIEFCDRGPESTKTEVANLIKNFIK